MMKEEKKEAGNPNQKAAPCSVLLALVALHTSFSFLTFSSPFSLSTAFTIIPSPTYTHSIALTTLSATNMGSHYSPLDSDEFAYPTNLGIVGNETDNYDSGLDLTISSPPTSSSSSKDAQPSREYQGQDQDQTTRGGHSRPDNRSSGSDLVQVTVEDLLISEELNRTIKASKSQARHIGASSALASLVQQSSQQEKDMKEMLEQASGSQSLHSSSSHSLNSSPIVTTTITATIRKTGDKTRSIHFDNEQVPTLPTRNQPGQEEPKDNKSSPSRKISRPPAPRILTPAQQREAEADDNIQKAIELHESNQLEEATRYFALAAQSENPLGQLMYGLSLRHGWVRLH